uniref:Uncharacterized protein n=1 Tax=Alexandrium catenella TaxID=2925 RepID=A0A7S1RKI8_ALECA|mmetsp:Transcript_6212/g.16601  ORF Transcript_6212/g.16601 Transcript_6212/m.16601 type:complete len:295 (+) Transcript_6212:100-984(+)|eukprot:CAMPEP_0171164224 /NCGR_PEP_ID=MMETSP0790-20130122/5557_1 /TAXON_ID=2925 /ORGANISM="Alexandrium catenella, Strain OF101" /LENGTH=294 /DNA_ID=CAMNT_0011628971 /DNA_START=98 /DNA_END=982 /DNA_ORIENTATION=-
MNGGTLIKPSNEVRLSIATVKEYVRSPSFLTIVLAPYAVFLLLLLLYTYQFIVVPSVCIILSLICALAAAALFVIRKRGPLFLPLAVGVLVSVVTGTTFGLYTYDKCAVFPKFYANSRLYTNVVPSQPAAAVSDAGRIVFTSESYVDPSRSAGFLTESGYTYCAAPVRDTSPLVQVEFWAVGLGCCDDRGKFWCDTAGNAGAHAGITVFDNNGFFDKSNFDQYQQAREKAEASFKLVSAQEPMFVRWVTEGNLDMLSNSYQLQTSLFLFMFCILQLIGLFGLAMILYKKPPSLV